MNVNLDGRPLTDEFPATETLQQCVTKVREKYLGTRMVVSIAYDGQMLIDQDLSTKLNQPITGVGCVDLVSAEPGELVAAAFREVAARMNSTGEKYQTMADEIQAGETTKALTRFGEYLEMWQTCQRAILEGSGMLARDLTELECGGRSVRAHLDDLSERLRELRGAFEAGDMVLLSDLFRYELPQTCETWGGVMQQMAGQIEHAGA